MDCQPFLLMEAADDGSWPFAIGLAAAD